MISPVESKCSKHLTYLNKFNVILTYKSVCLIDFSICERISKKYVEDRHKLEEVSRIQGIKKASVATRSPLAFILCCGCHLISTVHSPWATTFGPLQGMSFPLSRRPLRGD